MNFFNYSVIDKQTGKQQLRAINLDFIVGIIDIGKIRAGDLINPFSNFPPDEIHDFITLSFLDGQKIRLVDEDSVRFRGRFLGFLDKG